MNFKLFAALTILFVSNFCCGMEDEPSYHAQKAERIKQMKLRARVVERMVLDGTTMDRRADGSIHSRFLSGAESILYPDNTSEVRLTNGTTIHEYYCGTGIPGKIWVTEYPSGYSKTEDRDGQVTYQDECGQEVKKLPYDILTVLQEKLDDLKAVNNKIENLLKARSNK